MVTFDVVVTNTSPDESVTITVLTDNRFGDLLGADADLIGGASATTCNDAPQAEIAAGANFTCTITATLAGNAGTTHTNVVTATAIDNDTGSTPATDNDDADVDFTNVDPSIVVTKTAVPTSLDEPGGDVEFTVDVENTSFESVTITALSDDMFGDLLGADTGLIGGATATSCNDSLPITIAAGATFSCTIDATLTGDAGDTHTNVVTATAVDNDTGSTPATDDDDAVVDFTNVDPTITVDKTASPTSLDEPGGEVVFTVVVTNTSPDESVTITDLTDDRFGDLLGPDTDLIGGASATSCSDAPQAPIAAGANFTCTITASLAGNAGDTHTNVVTAIAIDNDTGSTPATDNDDADVDFTNVDPSITVDKTANPTSLDEPGGEAVFTVVVTNTSPDETVTLTDLTDNRFGGLLGADAALTGGASATTCNDSLPITIAAGADFSCTVTASLTGNAGDTHTNVVTATVVDDEGNSDSDNDDAVVDFTNVDPTITVDKTASPTTLPEPGGDVVFTVVVTNTSPDESVTITDLTDDRFGNLLGLDAGLIGGATATSCNDAPQAEIAAGANFTCTITATLAGDASDTHTNVVTAVAVDDEGNSDSDNDDAVVTFDNVDPTITVDKTADPTYLLEPGGDVEFTVVVTNTSPDESVTITALTDNRFGDLLGTDAALIGGATATSCNDGVSAITIAAGGTFSCTIDATLAGNAGDTHTNVVTATAIDNDTGSTPATDFDDADVDFTNDDPTVAIEKTANPTTLPEPGGEVMFTVVVTNTSPDESVTITALTDDRFGDLLGADAGLIGGATATSCNDGVSAITIAAGGTFTCTIDATLAGNAGDTHTNVVSVTAIDDDPGSTPATDSDDADVDFTNVDPEISIEKTANPTTLPEPGGVVTFDVVVSNDSPDESVTLTALTDDRFGDLLGADAGLIGGATATSCNDGVSAITIAAGGTFSCTVTATLAGNAGDTHTNVVTATAVDDEGNSDSDDDDAVVTFDNVDPTITVDKTASLTNLPEPGGEVTFTVVVTNTSPDESVTITALTDNRFGNLLGLDAGLIGGASATSCNDAPQAEIAAGGTFSCTVTATLAGNAGDTHTNVVTATAVDDEGNSDSDNDDADVDFTNVDPTITVDKTASPTTLPEPGGEAVFTVVVTNTSPDESVTITALTDNRFGDLLGSDAGLIGGATATSCNDAPQAEIAAGGTFSCTVTATLAGDAGDTHTNVVTAVAVDDEGNSDSDNDDAVVDFTNVDPSIVVTKTAVPTSLDEPGGDVEFTVDVENTSFESVTITDLDDDMFGDLLGADTGLIGGASATSCNDLLPISIAAGATFSCTIDATLTGDAGDTHTNVVTSTAVDSDTGSTPATDDDDAVVTFDNVDPTITVDKTASPTSLDEPGGDVVFTVVVTNTSPDESVTITALTDNRFGDLLGADADLIGGASATSCNDAPQAEIAAGGTFSCTITASLAGNAGDTHTNVVTATAVDDEGNSDSDNDDAVVTFDNVDPSITVVKTASPASLPEPGGEVVFTVVVTNTSPDESVTITALTDNRFGDLFGTDAALTGGATATSCNDAPQAPIAAGADFTCTITASLTGNAGDTHTNVVTATAVDDEGNSDSDNDDAVVDFTNVDPAITVTKTASPTNLPEPGGDVTYTVRVQNTSLEAVTITALTDDRFGDLLGADTGLIGGATATSCNDAPQAPIAAGGTFICTIDAALVGADGESHVNVVTAIAVDDEGNSDSDDDDATVNFGPSDLPSIVVTKTANPTSLAEPGGDVTFTVSVENTSVETLTITDLTDNRFGDLLGLDAALTGGATATTCNDALPIDIDASDTFTCTVDATLAGDAGDTHDNTVSATVEDSDANEATEADDATVTFTDMLPTITVGKTANPTTLDEPGGDVQFTVVVTNTSVEPVTITGLVDNRFGNLLGPDANLTGGATATSCNDAPQDLLPVSGTFTCTIDATLTGDAGQTHDNIVLATAVDNEDNPAADADGATVTFVDALPTIEVTKTANPTTLAEPGGDVTFTIQVRNTSDESVTITSLTDDKFGDLLDIDANLTGGASATSCNDAPQAPIAVGGTFTCTIDATLAGDAGQTHDNIVSSTAVDNENNPATDDATETVTFTNVDPTIVVTKTPAPASVPETGGNVVFTVQVENTSTEPVTITVLSDDQFGNLLGLDTALTGGATATSCNVSLPITIAVGSTFTCTIDATLSGDVGDTHTNVVSAIAVDNDTGSTPATDNDDADVTFTDVPPNIGVTKTPSVGSVDEPGDTVTFDVTVDNASAEAVTLNTLADTVFGNLLDAANVTVDANTCATEDRDIPAGGSFTCSFDADLVGTAAGPDHQNTVRAVATDNEGTPAEDDDSATVGFDDILPTISVDKTVNPGSLPEPGGPATFSVSVANTSDEPITLDSLNDSVFGNLLLGTNAAVTLNTCATEPHPIPVGGTFDCTFVADLVGDAAGADHLDRVTAGASDDEGNDTSAFDEATVVYTDVLPSVSISKSPSVGSIPEPGGPVTFSILVTNTSIESIVIDTLNDSDFGDLLDGSNPNVSANTCPAQATTLPIGGTLSCVFTAVVTGDASGADHSNTATVEAHDNEDNSVSDSDDATVEFTDALPNIDVTKSPSPAAVSEPGDTVTFTVTIDNTVDEDVTLTALVDDVYGNLLDNGNAAVSDNSCPTVSRDIAVGGTFTCSFDAFVAGNFGDPAHVNTIEASVIDNELNPATDDDSATVTYNDVPPTIDVSKNVTPGSLAEPGGSAVFTVEVTNTSVEAVTLDSLLDSDFGDLLDAGNGAVSANTCPTVLPDIAIGGTFACTFTADLVGDASGPDHANTVSAQASDDDGNPTTDSDDATVEFDDVLPTVTTTKTPSAGSVSEPGAIVTFTVSVQNTSPELVTLTDLVDDVFGDLLDPTNAAVTSNTCPSPSTDIAIGGTFTCTFDAFIAGNNGDPAHENTVTATVEDNDGNDETDDDDATVAFGDTLPTIDVTKTANPGSVAEPGGTVTFSVVVANTSVEAITLTALDDDQFGDLLDSGNGLVSDNTCAGPAPVIAVGDSFTCSFDAFVGGDASGPDHVNVVTAIAEDDDTNEVTDDDSAVVTITDVPPTVTTTKTPSVATVSEPGDTVTFSVAVQNTSLESVTLTSLTDDVFGDLLVANPSVSANTCPSQPVDMAPGDTFSCSFDAFVAGNFGDDAHVNTVTATVRDNDGTTGSDDDDATVDITDAPPNISVAKAASPTAVDEPGDTVTFTVEVTNSSVEDVTLTSLTDDVFGDLLNAGNSAVSANTCLGQLGATIAAGDTLTCTFDAFVAGDFGDPAHLDTVTAEVEDDDGNTVDDDDTATVTFLDQLPLIDVTKTPSTGSLVEPGGTVTFDVVVSNTGPEPVTVTTLDDTVFGNLLEPANPNVIINNCAIASLTIPVGGDLTCLFTANLIGDASGPGAREHGQRGGGG